MKTAYRDSDAGEWKGKKTFSGNNGWKKGVGDKNSARAGLHSAICSKCRKECRIPFKPMGRRPVFCEDCFTRDESAGPKRFVNGAFGKTKDVDPSHAQFKIINGKLDAILKALSAQSAE